MYQAQVIIYYKKSILTPYVTYSPKQEETTLNQISKLAKQVKLKIKQ